jgi:hypothetical protein
MVTQLQFFIIFRMTIPEEKICFGLHTLIIMMMMMIIIITTTTIIIIIIGPYSSNGPLNLGSTNQTGETTKI